MDTEVWPSLIEKEVDLAVESRPGRKDGAWEGHQDDFYETGRLRVNQEPSLVTDVSHCKVIDRGSGTGRLRLKLGKHFDRATCIDISRIQMLCIPKDGWWMCWKPPAFRSAK